MKEQLENWGERGAGKGRGLQDFFYWGGLCHGDVISRCAQVVPLESSSEGLSQEAYLDAN